MGRPVGRGEITPEEFAQYLGRDPGLLRAYIDLDIDVRYMAQKHKEEFEATTVRLLPDEDGKFQRVEVPAWKTRQEARKDAYKVFGFYQAEKLDVDAGLTIRVLQFGTEDGEDRSDDTE